jgi:hypothetical protein
MSQKFIQTTDKETRNILLSNGFIEISKSYGVYVFLNDRKMNFDKKNLKYTYTNKISV